MSLVLDTTFLVDVERKRRSALQLLDELAEEGTLLLVPTVVVAEYLTGSKDPEADFGRIAETAEVLDFSPGDARRAAEIAREALAAGRFPGWTDVLVAGFTLNRGAEAVVTANPRHFTGVPTRAY